MNDIIAAYENARFTKEAQPEDAQPSPLRSAQMNEAMRAVRDAIEESLRREQELVQQVQQGAQWGRERVQTPERSTWAAPVAAGSLAAGTGAMAESALAKYAPNLRDVHKAVSAVRGPMKSEAWNKLLMEELGAVPKGKYRDIEFAQALMPESRGAGFIPGRGVDKKLIDKLRLQRVRGKTKPKPPKVGFTASKVKPTKVRQKARHTETPFWKALKSKAKGVGTGRAALRARIMREAAKEQGLWARSPALRGSVKGLGAAAATVLIPYLISKLTSDVSDETTQAEKLLQSKAQLADLYRAWREAQFAQLAQAQRPEDVNLVPWAPYAQQTQSTGQ